MRRKLLLSLVFVMVTSGIGVLPGSPGATATNSPVSCPSFDSTQRFSDARDSCATAANALYVASGGAVQAGRGLARAKVAGENCTPPGVDPADVQFEGDSNDGAIEVGVEVSDQSEGGCDTYVVAGASGTHTTYFYPLNSLKYNDAGQTGYDANLPTGVVVTSSYTSSVKGGGAVNTFNKAGLTATGNHIMQVSSADNGKNYNNASFAVLTWTNFRVNPGLETDRQHDYRFMAVTSGSTHGGDSWHMLTKSAPQLRLIRKRYKAQRIIAWRPEYTTDATGDDPAFATVGMEIGAEVRGIKAGVNTSQKVRVSGGHYGPIILPQSPYDFFRFGYYSDGKKCDGKAGVCDTMGLGGTVGIQFPQGGHYAAHVQQLMCWQRDILIPSTHCRFS